MYRHGPSCLQGPVSRKPNWWIMDNVPAPSGDRPIRADLVERVRREIAAGTYETPEKWELALHRLLQRLEGEA